MYGDLGFSILVYMSLANSDHFNYSLPIQIYFISFSFLTTVARTSNIMLNRSGGTGHPYFVPEFSRKAKFLFTTENVDERLSSFHQYWLLICHMWPLLYTCMFPLYLFCWEFFLINGYWIVSNTFSASNEIIIWFLSVLLLMFLITLVGLHMLNHPMILEWIPLDHPFYVLLNSAC